MEMILWLLMILSLAYFCVTLAVRSPPPFRKLFADAVLQHRRMQELFTHYEVRLPVRTWQTVRLWTAGGWLAYLWASDLLFGEPLTLMPLLLSAVLLLLTGPSAAPRLLLSLQRRQQETARDGALIAFVRLYEMERNNRSAVQLGVFCERVAGYLPLLRHDLTAFAQRLTLEGHEKAFVWLASRFPEKHEFAQHVCTLLQTAERLDDPAAFLRENSRFLEKLSRDYYERRRKALAPWLNILNTVPSFMVFIMIIILILQYISVVKGQITV